jgi:hypothetical protein
VWINIQLWKNFIIIRCFIGDKDKNSEVMKFPILPDQFHSKFEINAQLVARKLHSSDVFDKKCYWKKK